MNALVVGLGHPDRGDDAAGWLVADLLERHPQLTVRRLSADPSILLTEPQWLAAREVLLVDAVRTGAEPGTVHRFDLDELLDAAPATGAGSHDLGITTTLRLARSLGRLPERVTVFGIEAGTFEPGETPCDAVLVAVEEVAATIETTVGSPYACPSDGLTQPEPTLGSDVDGTRQDRGRRCGQPRPDQLRPPAAHPR